MFKKLIMIKFFNFRIIVENFFEYLIQGIILTLALFIIPSFRSVNISFTRFIYFSFIIASMLVIIDRLLPDIGRAVRSFTGLGISTLSNPNLI